MIRFACLLTLSFLLTSASALAQMAHAPALSAEQTIQLQTARDHLPDTDEAALYPLLANALQWPANVQAGAMLPDYHAIAKDPAAHRGQLFLIEGTLRQIRPVGRLLLPGPWEGRITEWSIQWGDDPADMLIVNLVNAPQDATDYKQVRLAARFYKLWPTTTKTNQPKTFLLFVGHDAVVLGGRPGILGENSVMKSMVLLLCMLAFASFWILRKAPRMSMNPRPTPRQLQRRLARQQDEEQQTRHHRSPYDDETSFMDDDASSPLLPTDPAEALAALAGGNHHQTHPQTPSASNAPSQPASQDDTHDDTQRNRQRYFIIWKHPASQDDTHDDTPPKP